MMIIQNGLEMFQVIYHPARGVARIWKPDDNWRNIVIGAVILLAVILDQMVHVVQQRRRTKAAGSAAASPPTGGFPVKESAGPVGAAPSK
jgi:ribose transport system permease protein